MATKKKGKWKKDHAKICKVATLKDKVVFRIYPTHNQRAFERSSEED